MQGYEDKSPEMQTVLSSLQKYSFSGTDNMGKVGDRQITISKAEQRVSINLGLILCLKPQKLEPNIFPLDIFTLVMLESRTS